MTTESARFREAASSGDIDFVRATLSDPTSQFDINDRDDQGTTALHLAITLNHVEIVRVIVLETKCDVNLRSVDDSGHTPLHLAISGGSIDIVCILLNHERV
eukprot:818293_1